MALNVSQSRRVKLRTARKRWERERDGDRPHAERERADVEPSVAAEAVEDPAAAERSERHAKRRDHGGRAEQRAEDALPEVFAREHRIERHHAAIGEAEKRGNGVELIEPAGEDERARGERLNQQAHNKDALHAVAVGKDAERKASAKPRQP